MAQDKSCLDSVTEPDVDDVAAVEKEKMIVDDDISSSGKPGPKPNEVIIADGGLQIKDKDLDIEKVINSQIQYANRLLNKDQAPQVSDLMSKEKENQIPSCADASVNVAQASSYFLARFHLLGKQFS
ncbi:uncharacterized protein LOC112087476 [Eutrema salsugineum]|uniref:uncharacterized protein LOC112087476 n=1 Tax=Eutrema salsugineum TaxID=72664 RepID=UPI000CED5023|nr:uncharacterized protein LOC112087476 [Eutrema salsugineum]